MKILAIASVGGHWIQLLRLTPAFNNHELMFMTTKESFAKTVSGHKFFVVPDASRWNKLLLLKLFYKVYKIVSVTKPDLIITTGAAPGLMGIIWGRILGSRTIWVDSIANVEEVSLSGKIASKFADRVYTQWPNLGDEKFIYEGNVLS